MARYNRWQNTQLLTCLGDVSQEDVTRDRGAFFGSILGTLSHLLWGDEMWMSRFDPRCKAPEVAGTESPSYCQTIEDWAGRRGTCDAKMIRWADEITEDKLEGDLEWYSGLFDKSYSKALADCIAGFFNHQTHHRGQVHKMLTEAGREAPVTDFILMPETF